MAYLNTIIQFFSVKLYRCILFRMEIPACENSRNFYVKAVVQCVGERVFVHYILEVYLPCTILNLRRRGKLHTHYWFQFVYGVKATVCMVVMAIVH